MKLIFVSNYINHHQIPMCNALSKIYGDRFAFIQTEKMEEERINMGWQQVGDLSYLKFYYEDPNECQSMIDEADVVLFGGTDDESYIQNRLYGRKRIIRYSERMYKTGQWKAISPRGLLKKYKDHTRYRKDDVYMLCAGAYVPSDFHIVHAYPNKMFKLGYFPETKHYDVDKLMQSKGYQKMPYILWAARFIDWKHPELVIETAKYLKDNGYKFHIDMVGVGVMEDEIHSLAKAYDVEDCLTFVGMKTPAQVRVLMEKANIYMVTSDRQEGWGAVVNEAMNSGCAVVADYMIGATPYLINDGANGLIFDDRNKQTLFDAVEKLIASPGYAESLGREAYKTITTVWNAENAAKRLSEFIESGKVYEYGPMSKAEVISERKMPRLIIKH